MISPLRSDYVVLSSYLVGTHNTVYVVHSLHFALPYFAPLPPSLKLRRTSRSAKHRICWNVMWNMHFLFWAIVQLF